MKKLIAIVGMSGSGKSVASDYLEKKGFQKIYFGGVVLDKLKEENLEINPINEKMMRERLRSEYGMAAMAILLLPKIEEVSENNDTVLDGLYSWDEYVVLKEKFKDQIKLISVVNDKNIRYERVGKRKIRPLNKEEIEARDISETENLDKGGPIAMGDYFILNNGSIEEYEKRIDEILQEIDNHEKNKRANEGV